MPSIGARSMARSDGADDGPAVWRNRFARSMRGRCAVDARANTVVDACLSTVTNGLDEVSAIADVHLKRRNWARRVPPARRSLLVLLSWQARRAVLLAATLFGGRAATHARRSRENRSR